MKIDNQTTNLSVALSITNATIEGTVSATSPGSVLSVNMNGDLSKKQRKYLNKTVLKSQCRLKDVQSIELCVDISIADGQATMEYIVMVNSNDDVFASTDVHFTCSTGSKEFRRFTNEVNFDLASMF